MDNSDYILTLQREYQNKRGKIRCHPSGTYVNPLAMRARDIHIEDIAHHLANLCRYTGACPRHYSVADHSIRVSGWLELCNASPELQLAGLLHDAGEYVFNDIASPVKHDPRMKWYNDLEHETTKLIFCKYGVDPDLLPLTKEADNALFREEVQSWWGSLGCIVPRHPETSRLGFLSRFNQLMRKCDGRG